MSKPQGLLSTGENYPVVSQPYDREFIAGFNRVAERIYEWSARRGFWPDGDRNDGEALALIHSEVSEALECLRWGNPPDKNLGDFSGAEVQITDAVMRIMDLAHGRGWRVAEVIFEKLRFNESREYRNGKEF